METQETLLIAMEERRQQDRETDRASHTNLRVVPLLPGSGPRSRESILLDEDLAGSGRVSRRSAATWLRNQGW